MTHKLDGCLKDLREQADIGYDTITVDPRDWVRWEKEITAELDKIEGYTATSRSITDNLMVVAESTWRQI